MQKHNYLETHPSHPHRLVDPAPTLQASLISDRGALGDLSRTLGPEGDVTNNTFAQLIQVSAGASYIARASIVI